MAGKHQLRSSKKDNVKLCASCDNQINTSKDYGLKCTLCEKFFHQTCSSLTLTQVKNMAPNSIWYCSECKSDDDDVFNSTVIGPETSDNLVSSPDNNYTLGDVMAKLNKMEVDYSKVWQVLHEQIEENKKLKEELQNLRNDFSNKQPITEEEMCQEISQRVEKAGNIIIYNAKESSSDIISERISHDNGIVQMLFGQMNLPTDYICSVSRIGMKKSNVNRPLKVVLAGAFAVSLVFKYKFRIKSSELKISADQTKSQRNEYKLRIEELKSLSAKGDNNFTIKYINGWPKIVKKSTTQAKK